MTNVKQAVIVGLVVALAVLVIIGNKLKPQPIGETAQSLAEGEQSKLELQKKLTEVEKITTPEGGKLVFNELGWKLYVAGFDPNNRDALGECQIEMDTCPGWIIVAQKYGVDEFGVKYVSYSLYSEDVGLAPEQQRLYDELDQLIKKEKPDTNEEDQALLTRFATTHKLVLHEVKAILTKGSLYAIQN